MIVEQGPTVSRVSNTESGPVLSSETCTLSPPSASPLYASGSSSGQSGLTKHSLALIDHLRSIDKRRIRRVFGEISESEIAAIDAGLTTFLGLGPRIEDLGDDPVQ